MDTLLTIIRDHLESGNGFARHRGLLTPVSLPRLKEAAGAGTQLSKQKITGFKVQERGCSWEVTLWFGIDQTSPSVPAFPSLRQQKAPGSPLRGSSLRGRAPRALPLAAAAPLPQGPLRVLCIEAYFFHTSPCNIYIHVPHRPFKLATAFPDAHTSSPCAVSAVCGFNTSLSMTCSQPVSS